MTCPIGFNCQTMVGMVQPCPNLAVCSKSTSSPINNVSLGRFKIDHTPLDLCLIDGGHPHVSMMVDAYTRSVTNSL